ncbi:Bug family tripartite tricarboxylate transporter substrate binding protein [Ottowia thiooxydans]|uniref:Tripartite-type tricarboxylate transporter receptor subunit TctC n=1 Tax=Ottowia thiooxydans TaxID=219182 RepID=A0ABV2Q9N5_9BURK
MNLPTHSVRRRWLAALALTSALAPAFSWAQADYPNRPIRLLVGYAAGGGVDGAARLLANQLSQQLGQPVVVENRAGATGQIAADAVAKAAPDGYTLLVSESALMIARALQPTQSVDPLTAFNPVAGLFVTPLVIISNSDFPARTPADLVRELKRNPGKLSYATSGVGTVHHMGFEVLKQETNTFALHVPYRGASQIVPDVISGQVQLGVVSLTAATAQAKAGRVRALALMSREPVPGAESIRPLADAVPGFNVEPRLFLLAPAGTPAAITTRLSAAVKTALEQPETVRGSLAQGLPISFLGAQELQKAMKDEGAHWLRIVRERKLTAEGK